jgi:cytochrome P450
MTPAFPVSPVDPFADDILDEPYPFYADLRDAGPVVFLEQYGVWTCARHAEVQAVMNDWETYSSAAGVGIDAKPAAGSRSAHAYAHPHGHEPGAVGKAHGRVARGLPGGRREARR